jgi:predicted metal-dependent phosphoesterase TrpH
MRFADLHTHTYHSDGTRSPREVIDVARSNNLSIVAISDHDNVAAFFEIQAYAASLGVTLIPATELSCAHRGIDVHILAYAFDPLDERIEAWLHHFRDMRARRGELMVERLRMIGLPIRSERVAELAAGGSVGRPHVARAMVEAGYVDSVSEAFERFLRPGMPVYIEKERFLVTEATALIRSSGGLTSVAHPSLYPNHRALVPELLDLGVDGIEVFHPDVPEEDREHYSALAVARGALRTGGSDDHGTVKEVETLGTVHLPENLIAPILARL